MGESLPFGPRAPTVDDTGIVRNRQTIGHKSDTASNAATASIVARLKYVEGQLSVIVKGPYRQVTELPEYAPQDMTIVFAMGLFDTNNNNPIPVADITIGTVDVIHISGGVETPVSTGANLVKKDGLLYLEIALPNATYADGDQCKVEMNTKSSIIIDTISYDIVFSTQICQVTDLGDIGSRIDSLITSMSVIEPLIVDMDKGIVEADGFSSVYAIIDIDITFQVSVKDLLNDFIGNAGITTPGTCSIGRIRPGAPSVIIVASQACSAGNNGEIYYTYGWPSASWQKGDVAEITFSGSQITHNSKTFDFPDYEVYVPIGLPEMLQAWDTFVNIVVTNQANIEAKIDIIDINVGDIEEGLGIVDGKPSYYEQWSDNLITVVASGAGITTSIGTIVLPNWPNLTIRRVELIYSVRKLEEYSGSQNKITSGTMRIRKGVGAYATAYTFQNGEWKIDADVREGQGIPPSVSDIDIIGVVNTFNATYEVEYNALTCTADFLHAIDVKVGLRIWV